MDNVTLEDAAPSPEERQTVYEKGFRIWQSLYLRAMQGSGFPQTCFQIQPALLHHPYFPDNLDLGLTYSHISVSGVSIWEESQDPCSLPLLERHLQIPVSINSPTPVSVSADLDQSYQKWFNTKENHLSVLFFAWSYIFSARWAQLIPDAILAYTDSKAYNSNKPKDPDFATVEVNIGAVDRDAERWWAAILAPGEGWEAYITIKKDKFRSPWSISLPENPKFTYSLSCHNNYPVLSDTAISAEAAFQFLSGYCALHDIVDQGYAALSAVLFLPLLTGTRKSIILPTPKFSYKQRLSKCDVQLDLAWVQEDHHLDKLLTLSCNTKGIRSMLSSVLYEPGIACNVVSPWLQSVFTVIDSVKDGYILTHMLMSRVPHLAFLWLGGSIMDVHKDILGYGRCGLIPTDLHAAVWSETMQSFMQEPIHPAAATKHILRSDECRLLYLTQEERHRNWPMCQWQPFGATPLKDTEIDVRLHAQCPGHSLQYKGWKWTCRDSKAVHQMLEPAIAPTRLSAEPPVVMPNITINYEALNHEEESASEIATRSIFGWLRAEEGYPPGEKRIHEWINIDKSDDDGGGECFTDKDSGKREALRADVEGWIDQMLCSIDDS
ncbi:hypothetical protein BJX99DRAFT_272059 [Aspergillus californicus]